MILVFIFVFVFLWGYLKFFPRPHKLKMIPVVTVFGILVSILVSFLTVYGSYGAYDTDDIFIVAERTRRYSAFAQFSQPVYLELETHGFPLSRPDELWVRMFFANRLLWEKEFGLAGRWPILYVHPLKQHDVNYTIPLFYRLFLTFATLNMIGIPLAAVTAYKLETRFERLPQARQMKIKKFFILLLVIYILCLLFSLFYIQVGYKSGFKVVRYGFPLPWFMWWRFYAPTAEFYLLQFGFVIDSILYLAFSAGLSFLIVNFRIPRFHKRARSNRLYNWLIPRSP